MTCATCGFENAASAKFCAECGSRLAQVCPTCGTPTVPGAKFCAECGTNLLGSTLAAAQPGNDGNVVPPRPAVATGTAERRLVSVLFADLVGFTTLAQDRDPEAVRELLTRYFDMARGVVERYGGTIEKFIGDAVMAVWGTPVAHEDDPERAVRAGLDLVDGVRALAATIGDAALAVRVGVTSGETAVTLGATGQGMVAGDVVNTASRLQSVAAPNSVLVDERAERAARGAITFEPAGEQVLKGKAAGVPAWHALRVVAGRGGAGRAGSLEAPFVGRDDEFRLLKDLLHATSREGRTRLVSIMGQAGTGKSRLAWEFEKYVDGVVETVYWHRGRSLSYGHGISFWALGEMVRTRAGIAESDDATTSLNKLSVALAEYVPDETERRWIEPHLASLLGLHDPPPGQREQAFAAWRTLFERISALGTTVLVFEDLQWADAGLLDFIDHLLEWSRGHPILVVTLARHELLDRRADWGAGRRNFAAIALEPLSPKAMRAMLDGLVPGLPETAVGSILARAEGIPLYAVETVRMLLDDGRLAEADGVYRPTGSLGDLAVPATLHALIASRIDGLATDDRALVHAAAVLGQTFSVPALSAVMEQAPAQLDAKLRTLVQREILLFDVDPRSPERGQYGFTQAVIREVAYGTLSKRERRSRHLAAARYFEALGEEELAGVLASHYVAAYRSAPDGPEGEATAAQARIALRGAAERAAAVHDYSGAAGLLEQARDVTPDEDDRAALDERLAELYRLASTFDAADVAIRRAVARYESTGDVTAAARASATLGQILIENWHPAEAIPLLERALSVLDLDAPDATLASVAASLARAQMSAGNTDKALAWADRALLIAERAGARRPLVDALITRAWAVVIMRRQHEALATLIGALELARRFELPQEELRALNNMGAGMEEDPERVAAIYADMRVVATRYGHRLWLQTAEQALMWLKMFTGGWDAALEAARAIDENDPNPQVRIQRNGVQAYIATARGEFPEARRLVEQNGRLYEGVTKANDLATHHLELAFLALAEARLTDMFDAGMAATANPEAGPYGAQYAAQAAFWMNDEGRLQAALAAFETTSPPARGGQAIRAELEGLRAGLAGDVPTARARLKDAAEIYRSLRQPQPVAWIDIARVRILGIADPEGRAAADEARANLEGLRAKPFLEWLERAIAESRTVSAAVGRPGTRTADVSSG